MAQSATLNRASTDGDISPYRWLILVGLITAAILEVLDTTIINVSLPQMAGNLGATSEEIGWVSTGYILSNVVVLPMTAWLASRFGRRRYLSASIAIFIIASFFCGTSATLSSLIFWRIIQGAGGAALLSTAQATIREIFPKEQQGLVQSIYILGIIAAPTLGPTLGGYITDNFSWHWAFLINIPIGAVSFLLVSSLLEDSKFSMKTTSIDFWGIGLLAVGLGCLQYVLEEGNQDLWFQSPTIVILSLIAFVTLPAFIFWELSPKNHQPVVNLRVLKNRDLSASLILFVVLGFGLYGGLFLFPMFAQNILRLTPTDTGLLLLPGGLATGFSAMMAGRLGNPAKPLVDARVMIATGLALFTWSMVDLGGIPSIGGGSNIAPALLIRGFGLGLLFVPINLAAFTSLKGAEIAQASGLLNLCRQLGGSFGIAVLGTYVTNTAATARASLVANTFAGNRAWEDRLLGLQHNFMAQGFGLERAKASAYSVIERQIQVQSLTLAYNSSFLVVGAAALAASPLILLLRKPKAPSGGGGPAEAH